MIVHASRRRTLASERGIALVAVMSASSLLLALGLSLALTTTIEVGIAANQRDAVQTLHAADAALERAIADLALADWDAVLAGVATSPFHDGGGVVTLPDGSRLDVRQETNRLRCGAAACGDADMDRVTAARPWGRNNPRWTVFASGPLAELLPDAAIAAQELSCDLGGRRSGGERRAAAARRRSPGARGRRQSGQSGPRRAVAARAGLRTLGRPARHRGGGRTGPALAVNSAARARLA